MANVLSDRMSTWGPVDMAVLGRFLAFWILSPDLSGHSSEWVRQSKLLDSNMYLSAGSGEPLVKQGLHAKG